MAERITSIQATAFRGISGDFVLELPNGQSAVIFGYNGTGKSSIADALEWYFTGRIDLLTKEGREGALRNQAAPPTSTTSVSVSTTGSLTGSVSLTADPPAYATAIGRRETFLLRGRTLADFVNKTKSAKWQSLVELLGLEDIDRLRLTLQKVRNDLKTSHTTAASALKGKLQELRAKIQVPATPDSVLSYLREKCVAVGLEAPSQLDESTLSSWYKQYSSNDPEKHRRTQVRALEAELAVLVPPSFDLDNVETWNQFACAADLKASKQRQAFLQAALPLVSGANQDSKCPLCGNPISPDQVLAEVRSTLEELQAAFAAHSNLVEGIDGLIGSLKAAATLRQSVASRAQTVSCPLSPLPVSPVTILEKAKVDLSQLDRNVISDYVAKLQAWQVEALEALRKQIASFGSETSAELIEIGTFAEQAKSWLVAQATAAKAERSYKISDTLFKAYQEQQRAYFSTVLSTISVRTAQLYDKLHPGEGLGGVSIETMSDKGVELAVDFHGTRHQPPHGVLSESHLNSLAIAIFLAMAETFNKTLAFVVLDDVVTSFDIEHRGELAALLAAEFKQWQLIVLTHDVAFFDRLKKLAPSWKKLEVTSWTYSDGPKTLGYSPKNLIESAQQSLTDGDRGGAARTARRALEELLQETCEGLAAKLPFVRGTKNDHREAGQCLIGVRSVVKEISKPTYSRLEPLLTALDADLGAALNLEAHASQGWASQREIQAALDRIRELDSQWTCVTCHTRVWKKGGNGAWCCNCGQLHFPPPTQPAAATTALLPST